MRRICVYVAVLLLSVPAGTSAQDKERVVDYRDTDCCDKEGRRGIAGEKTPFTGTVILWKEKNKVKEFEAQYKDGWRDGIQTYWFVNKDRTQGKVRSVTTYKENKKNGLGQVFYENGRVREEAFYKDDKLHGSHKSYREDGSTSDEGSYREGKQDGLLRYYYPNGQVSGERNFKAGELHGAGKSFFENGKLKEQESHKDGKGHGVRIEYRETGRPEKESVYFEGRLLSESIYSPFTESDVLDRHRVLIDGAANEINLQYDRDGRVRGEYLTKNAKSVWSKKFHANGQLAEILTYDSNGQVKEKKFFDESGKPLN